MSFTTLDNASPSLQVLADGLKAACRDYTQTVQQHASYALTLELGHTVRYLARCVTLVLCAALGEHDPDLDELDNLSLTDLSGEDDDEQE